MGGKVVKDFGGEACRISTKTGEAYFWTNHSDGVGIQCHVGLESVMLDKEDTLLLVDHLLSYWEK